MSTTIQAHGPLAAHADRLLTSRETPETVVAAADELAAGAAVDGPATIVRPLLEAAALAAIAAGSVDAAVRFTRERPRPRPVPGVEHATGDPFSQTLLGEGHAEAEAAAALVRTAARELDEALAAGPLDDDASAALLSRALSAFDLAARVALAQGERVWEVVGTSGSARALGFESAWTVARTVSLRHPRAQRRRAIAQGYLGWLAAHRAQVGA